MRVLVSWYARASEQIRSTIGRLQVQWADLRGAELAQRLTSELHSARDLSNFVSTSHVPLSVVYGRLFRLDPLRDLRLSAARSEELARLLQAEREWLSGGLSSVLIVGESGSGRTSLLNLAQAEFNAPRLIRPAPIAVPRTIGLTRALAYELRRRPTRKEVATGLCTQRTVVLLDDLGLWFEPDASGMAELRSFLDLVVRTHREVFWVVTATTHWLELVQDVVFVGEVFGTMVRLNGLEMRGVRRVIEARHVLSGMELRHRSTVLSRVLGRAREDSAAEISFRLLHMVTGGNLQAALAAWCRAVTVDDGIVTVHPHRLLMERLPALTHIEAPLLGLLVQLVRFGPQDARRLSAALGLTRAEILRHIRLLENCGLLQRADKQSFVLDPAHHYRLVSRLPLSPERRP